MTGVSRRHLFAGAGGGLALGAAGGFGVARGRKSDTVVAACDAVDLAQSLEFYTGRHQAGIQTPPQRHCVFMTFDVVDGATAADVQVLLARWSAAIAQLMAGEPVGQVEPARTGAVGTDSGEALDLGPASLTVTLGLGPGVFDDRFGLAAKRPALLAELPAMPSDQLRPGTSGGDLALQACADDPQVAYHAIRDLARLGRGVVDTGWTVMGFGRASAGAGQSTPRNLMGFKDGTRNLTDASGLDEHVWIGADDPAWSGGTYWVVRKIRMNIETWDAADAAHQQQVFGRTKVEGAPLTGHREADSPDFAAAAAGSPVISPTSHIALAAPENNGGVRILRRGYNYTDGLDELAQLDAGLLFIGFMNDPEHFVRLQTRLGTSDQLNEYIAHIGSAIFVAPPGPARGHFLGESLFT